MSLTDIQRNFLLDEFGINESHFFKLTPLNLWRLREDCIEIECDEAMIDINEVTFRGNLAASVVDIVSALLPLEWRSKTPMQIQLESVDEKEESMTYKRDQIAVAV